MQAVILTSFDGFVGWHVRMQYDDLTDALHGGRHEPQCAQHGHMRTLQTEERRYRHIVLKKTE
jgi:hypothetical protein